MVAPFLLALQFLTRIPFPPARQPSEGQMRWSTAFYPLAGGLVGLASAGAFEAAALALPPPAAAACALAAGILITGGLHEDGLADSADAFGAGGPRGRMLKIMRDSHIGSFGTLALIVALLLQFALLAALPVHLASRALVAAHVASRFTAVLLAWLFPSARADGLGKSFGGRVRFPQIAAGLLFAAAAVWATRLWLFPLALALSLLAALAAALYSQRRIGGLTGDLLGAAIVLFHCFFYLGLAIHAGGAL